MNTIPRKQRLGKNSRNSLAWQRQNQSQGNRDVMYGYAYDEELQRRVRVYTVSRTSKLLRVSV